jgi:chromosome segregation ATPase
VPLTDSCVCVAQTRVAALQQENERPRRDNERFVRIIDSGEWGRGRVVELVQAGQVLKQERDQLRTLMGALRDDYESVERAKTAQHEELAALKDRMKRKGAANNKMLIKVCTWRRQHARLGRQLHDASSPLGTGAMSHEASGGVCRAARRSTLSCAR